MLWIPTFALARVLSSSPGAEARMASIMTRHDPKLMHRGLLAVRRNTIRRLLTSVFGIEHLREGQQRVIDSVLDG